MKENKTTILLVIVLGLMAWNLYTTSQIKTDVAGYNQKIDSIQKEVDSVYTVNKQIDKQIKEVDEQLIIVEKHSESVDKNLNVIKNNTYEKVNIVTTFGNVELNSYSQTDTVTNQDTTKVILSTRVARLIYQDLLRYDGSKLEIIELNKIISLKNEQIVLHKQKDIFKDQKIGNLELIITKKDEQFSLEREKSNSLLKELKGEKRKTFIYKIGTYVAIITTGLLLVK